MYITGTQYDFLNRLHQLTDTLADYDSFNAEFLGYTFDANEEFKIIKEQEKKLLTVGWDGGFLLNSSFDGGEAHWYTNDGFASYNPTGGTSVAIESGTLYFSSFHQNVSQADSITFPDLSGYSSLTVSLRAKKSEAADSASPLMFFLHLEDIALNDLYIFAEAPTLTTTLATYTFTLTSGDFESLATGYAWTDIKHATFSLEGYVFASNLEGNIGPQVKNVSLTLS